MIKIDPTVFLETSIPRDTAELNAAILEASEAAPDPWSLPVEVVRQARRDGKGIFPLEPPADDATVVEITFQENGADVSVPLRLIPPDAGLEQSSGTYLHIHGGGWMYGAADLQDQRLKRLANATNLTCVSVEYRLTPEHVWPACINDCTEAALALQGGKISGLATAFLAIGGESAGGQLAAAVLQRLMREKRETGFDAALLIAGAFDMGMTPSGRQFNEGKLVLTTRDIIKFADALLASGEAKDDPSISPLYGDCNGMPPAHFSIGTKDALLDDSIFMATKWSQSQPDTELDLYAGGPHVFHYWPDLEQTRASEKAMFGFLNRLQAQKTSPGKS